ncbi:unnamed protein product [Nippostrongylus brasiliensis]|uniref:Uncharacterized protein n=1 Tax=Nippostrongylus brasiliensis TaxID=27835 RepID=A0A3P7D742_NIPBR|nr:unnamed protein product [Nippostrongylus brasiliensis]
MSEKWAYGRYKSSAKRAACSVSSPHSATHINSSTHLSRMSKAPTVSELVGNSNITFKPAVGSHIEEGIRPDFDTDVLWKPSKLTQKHRTVSIGSSDSENGSVGSRSSIGSSPVDVPRPRRFSISEMIFGSPAGGFTWGQGGLHSSSIEERRASVTDDERFKEFLKHQNKVLGDDGVCSFKKRDYMK